MIAGCPLYPRKRTSFECLGMSVADIRRLRSGPAKSSLVIACCGLIWWVRYRSRVWHARNPTYFASWKMIPTV